MAAKRSTIKRHHGKRRAAGDVAPSPKPRKIMRAQRDHRGRRYPRRMLAAGFIDALELRIRAESRRFHVSMSFVIAVALGDYFGIDHERY